MTLRTRINRLNKGLAAMVRNHYFEQLPLDSIKEQLEMHGFSTAGMEGIWCGHHGQTTVDIGENVWMNVSWYRMDSGRYEVVVYASKGVNR